MQAKALVAGDRDSRQLFSGAWGRQARADESKAGKRRTGKCWGRWGQEERDWGERGTGDGGEARERLCGKRGIEARKGRRKKGRMLWRKVLEER